MGIVDNLRLQKRNILSTPCKAWLILIFVSGLASCDRVEKPASEKCFVADGDIAARYEGDCQNGKANGRGVASGRDRYVGEFKDGEPHGSGTYYWGKESKWPLESYHGDFWKGGRTGIGEYRLPVESANAGAYKTNSTVDNGFLVQKGLFVNGEFWEQCGSIAECRTLEIISKWHDTFASRIDKIGRKTITINMIISIVSTNSNNGNFNPVSQCVFNQLIDAYVFRTKNYILDIDDLKSLFSPLGDKNGIIRLISECDNQITEQHRVIKPKELLYQPVKIPALLSEAAELEGEKFSVEGIGSVVLGSLVIRETLTDMNPLIVKIDKLTRNQKDKVFRSCSSLPSMPCKIVVKGVVSSRNGMTEIVADDVSTIGNNSSE